ncbi:MAG: DUF1365 domain-containing protein [Rickettsiales bacterium]|nr:DUF1365 domain-containing protein [Rickettsiales bacterium]
MEITPQIYTAKVMHKRLFPKVNAFTYSMYYLALPLVEIAEIKLPAMMSFHAKDHGAKEGADLEPWIRAILADYGLNDVTEHITLISMPRILGYVFNPVSFWLCLDENKQLRAVLAQVNNTFGETHHYLCAHTDHRVIDADDLLVAQKLFHVSPFLKREGSYQFRFSLNKNTLGIWIDFYDAQGEKQLITSLTGTLTPLTKQSLRRAFWTHPLVTLKTIFLIHWQAIKLLSKGLKYISKPTQRKERLSSTDNLTKW